MELSGPKFKQFLILYNPNFKIFHSKEFLVLFLEKNPTLKKLLIF